MRLFTSTTLFLSIIFSIFLMETPVSAQIPTGDFIQIEQSPEVPRSFQTVTISLKSFSSDLHNATITWLINGKQVAKGKGVTQQQVEAGAPGSSTSVTVNIVTSEGVSVQKTLTLRPGDVDLVWEADSYTPPFFKGRPAYTYQSDLKVVAIPNFFTKSGTRIDPKTLVYTWKQDGTVLGSLSGYGKDSLVVNAGVLVKPTTISVLVTGNGDLPKGESTIEMEAIEPEIVFYEESPLYGTLFNKAISDRYELKNSEATFVAVPYFFSNNSKQNSFLSYVWSINNLERADLKDIETITLRHNGEVEGVSSVGLTINNTQEIFQKADKGFSVQLRKRVTSEPIGF